MKSEYEQVLVALMKSRESHDYTLKTIEKVQRKCKKDESKKAPVLKSDKTKLETLPKKLNQTRSRSTSSFMKANTRCLSGPIAKISNERSASQFRSERHD